MSETLAGSGAQAHNGEFVLRVRDRFSGIDRGQWRRLSGAAPGICNTAYNPFVSHAFLNALEQSGCATADSGWHAQHLALENARGDIVAAAPCYLKSHSQGEYVFDHSWADAYQRAGGRYYPKLQCSVPFTPVTGPRLLVSSQVNAATARLALANGLRALAERLGV
ncbi:MAG: peptidogalycan biosysnthesis protein, partial [Oricola sp.]